MEALEVLRQVREEALARRSQRTQAAQVRIMVSLGSCGLAAGARETLEAILEAIHIHALTDVTVARTGCLGLCGWEPTVVIQVGEEEPVTYGPVSPSQARHLVQEHVVGRRPVYAWTVPRPPEPVAAAPPPGPDLTFIGDVLARYGREPEALVAILRELDGRWGYLPGEGLAALAQAMGLPAHRVFGAASFYSMLHLTPPGEHVIRFCQDAPCHLPGGEAVSQALQEATGLRFGETSPDGRWTLLSTSCLGLCGVGPVLLVDEEIYSHVTPERVPDILNRYGM